MQSMSTILPGANGAGAQRFLTMSARARWLARGMRLVMVTTLIALLAACATGPRVRTDYDPSADFAQFRTWGFYQPIAMEESGYSSWISDRIKDNVRREMQARGYRYVEDKPDLQVNFQGIVRERTSVWSVPRTDQHWFYSYRRRAYFAVPFWYDETQVSQYTEGTLTVDLVDAQRNRMVWTGAAIGRVVHSTPAERAAQVDVSIASIFAQYPYSAGSVQPSSASPGSAPPPRTR